ncbi:hypothetical protein AMATHDRAFT_50532 [Amanita thiersii Skay4041]|uniref:Uncharacterized protein n=1 Tax=Amanita thiersii Skay4041 TaxID=703135 RepID=A0A2A9NFU3_9AGAR|nr:hypothetical protein AMATHDRAFT_50532 [Amanita thiersii Skay4041]
MPDYVYALHDFFPENEDEISFRAGDRIEVIEKDEQYGDGWWQGRNLEGNLGLFPQSYTAPAPPQPAMPATSSSTAVDQVEDGSQDSEHRRSDSDGEMMKATLTDVQKAIEQLGQGDTATEDGDGARSFSFASSRDDRDTEVETDTDPDTSDLDRSQNWHNSARRKLAEKARRAVEEAEKLEALMGNPESRSTAPPIECEVSDESEDEGDVNGYTNHIGNYQRHHSRIPEEDEEAEDDADKDAKSHSTFQEDKRLASPEPAKRVSSPLVAEVDVDQDATSHSTVQENKRFSSPVPSKRVSSLLGVQGDIDKDATSHAVVVQEAKRLSSPKPAKRVSSPRSIRETVAAAAEVNLEAARTASPQPLEPVATTTHIVMPVPVANTLSSFPTSPTSQSENKPHPSEWSVADVAAWLKSKGFDQDVQDRFIEQEITGDVLLELDANLLKTEIGIMAYGKRVRIANAIADLRRPSSSIGFHSSQSQTVQSQNGGFSFQTSPSASDQFSNGYPTYHSATPPHMLHPAHSHSPLSSNFFTGGPGSVHAHTHSRTHSQSQHSHHSFPGSTSGSLMGSQLLSQPQPVAYAQSVSVHSSLGSPIGYGTIVAGLLNTSPGMNGINGSAASPTSPTAEIEGKRDERVGLGIGMPGDDQSDKFLKPRPAQLSLSPSDGALSETVKAVNESTGDEEERGHMSESEASKNSKITRRRLFGRSHDSSVSKAESGSRTSKDLTSGRTSPVWKEEKETSNATSNGRRAKKGTESGRSGSERLSIFGSTFGGSIGKSRKPPPQYAKLSGVSVVRKASNVQRPNTSNGSPKWLRDSSSGSKKDLKEAEKESEKEKKERKKREKEEEKEAKEVTLLRKRTSSIPHAPKDKDKDKKVESPVIGSNNEAIPLKQGRSILEQIGEPDHGGWMRKRGDRYNSWKTRYFVLSGPHLYCLRSNSKTETKIKGYINIVGYKVTVDETVDPGKYGFRIDHEHDKTHYFSSDDKGIIREWMKSIMKATIGRDYTKPVISSCNIPTIPLTVAQAMNPAPRPPSPSARAATQKAHRSKDLENLGVRDINEVSDHATLVLMGLRPQTGNRDSEKVDAIFPGKNRSNGLKEGDDELSSSQTPRASTISVVPPRPTREARRHNARSPSVQLEPAVIEWANSHLPSNLQVTDPLGPPYAPLALFRLAESIRGYPASPPVPDSAFPADPQDEKSIDGLFSLFDFMVTNDVKVGSVSINDIRMQRPEKVAQIVKALKAWEDKRKAIAQSVGRSSVSAGAFMAMNAPVTWA